MMSSMTVFHKTEMYEDFQRQTDRISEEINIRCKHDRPESNAHENKDVPKRVFVLQRHRTLIDRRSLSPKTF